MRVLWILLICMPSLVTAQPKGDPLDRVYMEALKTTLEKGASYKIITEAECEKKEERCYKFLVERLRRLYKQDANASLFLTLSPIVFPYLGESDSTLELAGYAQFVLYAPNKKMDEDPPSFTQSTFIVIFNKRTGKNWEIRSITKGEYTEVVIP